MPVLACQVAIYAGAGVKERLDEKRIGSIIGAMRPLLRAGKFDEALEGAVVDIGIALAGGPEDRGSFWGFLAALLFFGLFFTVLITSCLCAARLLPLLLTITCCVQFWSLPSAVHASGAWTAGACLGATVQSWCYAVPACPWEAHAVACQGGN